MISKTDNFAGKFVKLGADIVYPEQDMAIRLANRLEIGHAMDFIELSESIDVAKFNASIDF